MFQFDNLPHRWTSQGRKTFIIQQKAKVNQVYQPNKETEGKL